ncbi:MAG: MFS transporter [Candidatus Ranarchaeia archaeon]
MKAIKPWVDKHAAVIALGSASTAHFLHHVYTSILGPLIPLIRLDIPLNYVEIGILGAVSALTITTAQILIGPVTDRFGPKIMILFSILIPCAGLIFSSMAVSFFGLIIAQIIIGLGGAAYHPAGYVLIKRHFPSQKRGRALAVHSALGLQGSALIPVLATFLAYWLSGWRASFIVLTLPSFIISLAIAIFLQWPNHKMQMDVLHPTVDAQNIRRPYPSFPSKNSSHNEKHLLASLDPSIGPLIVIMLVSFSRISAYRVVTYFGSTFIVDEFGLSPNFSTTILSFVLFSGSIVNFAGGWLADRVGRRNTLIASNLFATPTILLFAFAQSPAPMIAALLAFSVFFFAGSAAESAYLADVAPLKSQAAIFGIVFSVETGVASLTISLTGLLAQLYGLRVSMVVIAMIVLLGVFAASLMREQL